MWERYWERYKTLIIPLAISITGSILAQAFYKQPWLTLVIFFLLLAATLAALFCVQLFGKLICSECWTLRGAGLSRVYEDASRSLSLTINQVTKSYRFLGVSAERVVETPDFRDVVERKIRKRQCQFHFILLSPEATSIIQEHAESEDDRENATALLKERITLYLDELKALKKRYPDHVRIFLYNQLPIFRLVLVNDTIAYVSFYGAKGKKGVDVPQLVFQGTDQSFCVAFRNYFDQMKKSAKEVKVRTEQC